MSRPGVDDILRWPLFRPLDLRAKDSRMSEIDTCAPECGERDPKPNTPDPSNPNPIFPDPSAKNPRPRRDLAEVGGAEEGDIGEI